MPARRKQLERYLRPEDRARCLVAGLMLRYALGEEYGKNLSVGAHGKPYLRSSNLFFNLSHAGEYAALAVASSEVGVDVEQVRPYQKAIEMRCCTEAEQEWLKKQKEIRFFYRLWTGKESIMKATGLGFLMPPETISILPAEDGPHSVAGKVWHLYWHSLSEYEICIACETAETPDITVLDRAALLQEGRWNGSKTENI